MVTTATTRAPRTDDLCGMPIATGRACTLPADHPHRSGCTDTHLDARRFVWDSATRTWAIRCDSDICEGRELENGFRRLDWALEDTASHDCEAEAEADYDRRYDNGWSYPA